MRVRKNIQRIALAVALAVAAAFCVYFFLNNYEKENSLLKRQNQDLKTEITQTVERQKRYNYIVAKKDIKNGETLDIANIEAQEFKVPIQGAYDSLDEIAGLVVIDDVPKGKPLTIRDFNAQALTVEIEPRVGYRAIMLTMPYNYYPSFLNYTSVVDIYNIESRLKARNINVLSIKDNPQKQEKKIVVEIKEQDVMNFISAATKGEMIFVQKNHKEGEHYSLSMGVPIFSDEVTLAPSAPVVIEQIQPVPEAEVKKFDIVEMIEGAQKTKVMFERD